MFLISDNSQLGVYSVITFSRLSSQDVLPLVSRVTVNPVSSGLNGTVVNCFEGISSTDLVATTTIRIIDSQQLNYGKTRQSWRGSTGCSDIK